MSYISIHALLAESDHVPNRNLCLHNRFLSTLSLRRATIESIVNSLMVRYFYPRSPCGERRHRSSLNRFHRTFLSTLSLRRATYQDKFSVPPAKNFYPRSPCGERPIAGRITSNGTKISIHALLAESDEIAKTSNADTEISIHALLAESDNQSEHYER